MAASVYIPTNNLFVFFFSTSFPRFLIHFLCKESHSDGYEVVWIFIYLMISNVDHFLHVPVGYLCILVGKMSIHFFCPFLIRCFFFFMLSYMSCLCMLDINTLSFILLANIFSHSVVCFLFS